MPDPLLCRLDGSDFDELWLFALDSGDGLTEADCEGITRFRQRGGGILAARDHQDMGSSLCTLGGVGLAHDFQTRNPEPGAGRRVRDDVETPAISWPNSHPGRNGDSQQAVAVEPEHELLVQPIRRRQLDTSRVAPAFVTEHEGTGMRMEPKAIADIQRYVRNLAFWLAPPAPVRAMILP